MPITLLLATALAGASELHPGARYDPAIPTLRQVVGHDPGEEITSPEQVGAYLRALAEAAPDRTRLWTYAESWQGRPLQVLAIGSPPRIGRLDEVKAGLRRLADPRGLAPAEAERLLAELPAVAWLIHGVHGNETSSADAGLALAHHLLASRDDPEAERILGETLVLVDPMQNPDGRARFLASFRQGRAKDPDPEPAAAEHDEPWPGGRSNHYLFDMNRDWFALTQPETRGRVALFLDFFPHVVVDLHEMGGNSTYFFAPPAPPVNPALTASQRAWWDEIGRANAARFDARGFPYFVREIYDSFYPGYGESWPLFHGAVGMTYEQASARGLLFRRSDDTVLRYYDGVVQHFTAALTTLATAAKGRARLLRDFLEYRRAAVREGSEGGVREYLIPPGADPARSRRLADLLAAQGIEVRRADEPLAAGGRSLPAGTFAVSLAQPAGRLARSLLGPAPPMDEAFVREQDRRRRQRLPDQVYDVTAWGLPLAFDVECLPLAAPVAGRTSPYAPGAAAGPDLPEARVAYLLPWGSGTAALVAEALRAGLKVRVAELPFRLGGRDFPAGTAVVRVSENRDGLRDALADLAGRHHAEVVAADSGYVESGISLGSNQVRALRAPRVLLAWDRPTQSLSAGWARWVLERRFGQPVTAVRVASLGRVDLARYDVLVLPSGDYSEAVGEALVKRLRTWVSEGGTLVALADAARWAATEKAGLLSTHAELRGGRPDVEPSEKEKDKDKDKEPKEPPSPFDYEKAVEPERERPGEAYGAFLRVELDREHWLAAGNDGAADVLVSGSRIFTPLKLDKGRNVGVYAKASELVAAGLVWDETRDQVARKAFLMHQPLGRGHVVAFAEDPNFRGFAEATELMFLNAVLLGPAY